MWIIIIYAFQEVEHDSTLLKCDLLMVSSFLRGQHGKEEKQKDYGRETCQMLPQPGDQGQCQQ